MPLVVSYDDIDPAQVIHYQEGGLLRPASTVYPFLKGYKKAGQPNQPSATLVRYGLGTMSGTHYHAADQFQIIVEGRGMLGHHELRPYNVHFARAYTPYGPLVPDKTDGWAFLTLRVRADPEGGQRLSVAREKLAKVPNRRPWQITRQAEFPAGRGSKNVSTPIDGLVNGEGLFGISLRLLPAAKMTAPSPSNGDGQYMVALAGSLIYQGKEYKAPAVAFIPSHEEAFRIEAGPGGLDGLILNFPKVADTGGQGSSEGRGDIPQMA